MADRVMDRLMDRAAEIITAGLDDRQSLSLLVRDHIEVALTERDALAVYHREVRTRPESECRRLSRSQRALVRGFELSWTPAPLIGEVSVHNNGE
jgi:hypothetical protein